MPAIVLTGQHVCLYVNGAIVGRVNSFRWSRSFNVRRAQGIDTVLPSELIPGAVTVNGSIGLWRVRKDGGAEGAGLIVPTLDLPRQQYVSLMLKDRLSDTVIARIDESLVTSEGWSAEVRSALTATVSFEARDVVCVLPKGHT